jgi:hypothetical protein
MKNKGSRTLCSWALMVKENIVELRVISGDSCLVTVDGTLTLPCSVQVHGHFFLEKVGFVKKHSWPALIIVSLG